MKYIDAERLRARIEKSFAFDNSIDTAYYRGRRDAEWTILTLIDSLQQEQPEVDLEKDIESWFFNEISSKINVEHTMYHYFQECARRYFELGRLNAEKEEE